ncbi:GNAT family N-acetyltransferase [Lacicoccus qingdaonensis]|uniref:Protein N-acetyltransferase, RimJ/RimL family n=1 Tax=Lacicoccus qingdaonensis TaxID=576118 RepID=A0A1G9GL18_9BACL|nr:GNAT family protein [Salinicoccus qingdaonensis]SDL01388.1 Protein N-acetyltransferase, RimJ/RimL family [Salinicoccus qingdaonensis]
MNFYLRDVTLTDTKDIHSYASLDEVSKYQGWGPDSLKDTENHVKMVMESDDNYYHKVIVDQSSDKVIGAIELSIDKDNDNGEIGYILHPEYWGRGIGTKAVHLILEYGFNELKLNRISATTDKRNTGSERVMQKSGMTKEGLLRENIKLKDGYRDTLVYSILSNEYHDSLEKFR